jgi:synapsin
VTGNWKVNTGSATLEQIPVTDRYKFWVDEVSRIFGGLDICGVQAVVSDDDNKEYIIDIEDSALNLIGETQDNDRFLIADLVIDKMSQMQHHHNSTQLNFNINKKEEPKLNRMSLPNKSDTKINNQEISQLPLPPPPPAPHAPSSIPQQIPSDKQSNPSNTPQQKPKQKLENQQLPKELNTTDNSEDTMKNLKKTFAGIFGEI